jgi:hypothetical protein
MFCEKVRPVFLWVLAILAPWNRGILETARVGRNPVANSRILLSWNESCVVNV